MSPSKAFLDALFRARIEHARRMSPEQRFVESLRHSDAVVRVMKAGVQSEFPSASEDEVLRILSARLERVRRVRSRR